MSDKEIIIDGVDVSKCRHFLKDTKGPDYNTDEYVKGCCEAKGCYIECEFIGYSICRGDKDCYYKQLSRKTAECDELKERLERVEEDLKHDCVDCMNIRSNKYYEALNDIEELISGNYETLDPLAKQQIQNIISKAKDGKNEKIPK